MPKNRFLPLALIAVAILAGCAAPKNASLTEAHGAYTSASSNPQVANLAALELKEASDSLNKAEYALSHGEDTATVNQLAYLAKQKVAIAQEAAKRKTAESAVTIAGAKRDEVRLAARTAEADAAKQQVADLKKTADWQAEELAAANANAQQDQALIAQQEMQIKELNTQKLNAQKTPRGLVITLGDVLFSTNKALLNPGGVRSVQKLAGFLRQYPQHKALIEGHTDSIGSDSLNLALSERRADAVRSALVDSGISADRVTTRGYGEAFPVASNDTAASRQLNRRVEIILSDDKGYIAPR